MMKAYFYVEARAVDGLVSFKHIPVSALCDQDAYDRGARMASTLRRMGHCDDYHSQGRFLNDYVIEVLLPA